MRSLRLRVLLTIAAVSFVTLAGVGLFSSRTATLDLERFDIPPTGPSAGRLATTIESAYARAGSWRGIDPALSALGKANGRRIVLVSPSGRVIGSSDSQFSTMHATFDRDGTLHLTSTSPDNATAVVVLREPTATLHDRRGARIALMYVLPNGAMAPLPRQIIAGDINRSIWIAVGVAAIAAAIAAFVLSTHILRPVRALTAAAERVARGDMQARVPVTGADEIGALGRSFNAMADGLARLERVRKDMVADVAHELRTPLTHIRGRIEAIQDGRMQPTAEIVASLHADVLLLERLVRDIQDLSLADAGQLRLALSAVSLPEIARSVAMSLTRDPPIELRMPDGLPNVVADPERLRQILHNLVANALGHASEGGAVWIAASLDGGEVRATVHNDGPTLAASDLTSIFERFYRTDKSRSRDTGGAGLGLAIVKQLVEASGGRVWAENTTQPEGVSIVLTLPASA